MIYFDHAATTPMSPTALKAYTEVAQDYYSNPESLHEPGTAAGFLVRQARLSFARQLHVPDEGLIFTSGGTQANQLGIAALAHGTPRRELLVSPLEHSSVYEILTELVAEGYRVKELPVDHAGKVTVAALTAAISADTAVVIVQAVNAITGIVQETQALNAVASAHQVPLFVDAVQGAGKVPLDLSAVAGFAISAHKFNGPKSCGVLYLSPLVPSKPRFSHVFQQAGYLPGTMDTPGIVSTETAFDEALTAQAAAFSHLAALKEQLLAALAPSIVPVAPWAQYPGIIGLLLPHTQGQEAATWLGQHGVCISTVSACSIKDPRPDKTLLALGLTAEQATRFVRLSLGAENTAAEVASVVKTLNSRYS